MVLVCISLMLNDVIYLFYVPIMSSLEMSKSYAQF